MLNINYFLIFVNPNDFIKIAVLKKEDASEEVENKP